MDFIKDFNYSYWEVKQYFKTFDLVVIGSGIVGLSTAISFKELHPKATVLVLERGILPNGASTKNAGFACFGSAGELLDDLKHMAPDTVWQTVAMRWKGLALLRKRLKDKNMHYKPYGGFELFTAKPEFDFCKDNLSFLNKEMKSRLGLKNCYSEAAIKDFSFQKIKGVICNSFEGQIDTGSLMENLTLLARKKEINILNNVTITALNEVTTQVELISDAGIFKASKVVVATNGFAKQLLAIKDVEPARAQVLITKPVGGLKIKGAFHFSNGYYYFRNIDNRILFGGGRNLDFKGETTPQPGLSFKIQNELDKHLEELILPGTPFEVEQRWSGIMGVGHEKKPLIKFVGKNILAAVRMGGMGIAIGSLVGEKAAKKLG